MLASDGVFDGAAPRVLDLYAGSGALGFEALSRGAASVVFVESARPAIEAIRKNVRALDVAERVDLVTTRDEKALELVGGPFDLVLVDPPYAEVRTRDFDDILARAARRMRAAGVLVLEHSSSDEPPAAEGLQLDRRRRHGDTTLSLFLREEG
jgi:16S rRNA (guanine966-N2)-methyltransferase